MVYILRRFFCWQGGWAAPLPPLGWSGARRYTLATHVDSARRLPRKNFRVLSYAQLLDAMFGCAFLNALFLRA